jgi:UDP-glucose 4-epimerase
VGVRLKILVTGGAGFIGSNLSSRLVEDKHSVKIIDDLSTGLKKNVPAGAELIIGSILDRTLVNSVVKGCDVVVHLAARGSVPRSIKNPRETHDVNATGTQIILESASEVGCHVIYSSSSSVYGLNSQLPKNEEMVLKPATPYAASKMAAEGLALSYANTYNFPVTVFRFFNIFGPRQRADHEYAAVIPKWIDGCIKNKTLTVFGDGNQTRDFTYIDTVVELLNVCVNEKITHPEPINLAFGSKISLNTVIDLLKLEFPNIKVLYEQNRKGDIPHSENNPKLINQLFKGIEPISFKLALEKTVNWQKVNA